MAVSNSERIGKGLELLKQGLAPFIEREMNGRYGPAWKEKTEEILRQAMSWQGKDGAEVLMDVQAMFVLIGNLWHDVFGKPLGRSERTLVFELRDVRNNWAHQQSFSTDDAYRALDSMERLLTAISAKEAREVGEMKQELLRNSFAEKARWEKRKASSTPIQGQPSTGLKPWREIVTPHPDVSSGRYQQAEFAADLAQVHRGEGAPEYSDPKEFFRRTFLTEGLSNLLKDALLRTAGKGGAPAVELQTNFGGGKTHSMLALYHLFGKTPPQELAGVEELMQETGVDWARAYRAVLVGTALSPGQTDKKEDGTVVHTLWGEMAWQLGGVEGYAMVAESDQKGISPGSDVLQVLFTQYSPSLILIDEWVRYVGQTYEKRDLPAGSFDANITFAQALTEAAKRSPGALVVASIPSSDIEMGGEGGREALARLKNTFSRLQSAWSPASTEEGFEIVRRRLFEPISEQHRFAARDAVINGYAQLYREQTQEFPSECKEGDYRRRMEAAYPIHPELFDRLYGSWSSLDKFQRTRGVLRLMAAVIHTLWERNDSSLLIMPGMIPVDEPSVQSELTKYLDDPWRPVIERDVDGVGSLPLSLERGNPNLARYSAARRVARTIYMGSAPHERANNRGIEEKTIKLGCVQPGESAATFGDALRRLTDQATHLYVDGKRYWYSTQPSVTRLGQDRAEQQDEETVKEELLRRLRSQQRDRGEFTAVHIAPESGADIPDETTARLVILGPNYPHSARNEESPARIEANNILNQRGSGPRLYRNMLMFLAPDRTRLEELNQSIRQYLAWESIMDEEVELNLDAFQRKQADTKRKQANDAVQTRLQETYIWLLNPTQDDQGPVEWEESRLKGSETLAKRASKKLLEEEGLITQFAAFRLRMALNKYYFLDSNHVGLKRLWEDFASYLYLPRLRDRQVLIEAVEDGIRQISIEDTFAYAEGWDEKRGRYLNLQTVNTEPRVMMNGDSVIVAPEAALKQEKEDEEKRRIVTVRGENGNQRENGGGEIDGSAARGNGSPVTPRETGNDDITGKPSPDLLPQPEKKLRRFFGTVQLDPVRFISNANDIANEIIQHLQKLDGAEVEIRVDIEAYLPDGAKEDVVRTVTENSRTLKFKSFGFEEE
ncbi:Swt1 family HEPN domain-containing protein [Desmospora profundinema]|uniref:AAA+ superfamily ATPase n=1 Tax=Desmospora profundinema TaxID=1571184 RepID=A0ABU1IN12_9BACL|nr:Swt1 family HEPN domain-containing protein [Desmospora profundinema]MDR6226166.1 putative AAA+ superfamily ATPase [Desmospora profundinema]